MTAIDERRAVPAREPAAPNGNVARFDGLPYGRRLTEGLPALHAAFNAGNRYVAVPALRLGLGRYLSTPLTGYLMLLRTRGRKTGANREAPLGYVIVGDAVYCTAGFGRKTYWFQNILADPRVEVILPSRSFSGIAEEVTDPDEIRRVTRPLAESMAAVTWLFTGMNPRTAPDAEIVRVFGAFPLVRIRATGIAAGPDDPRGHGWLVSNLLAAAAVFSVLRAVRRLRARRPVRA